MEQTKKKAQKKTLTTKNASVGFGEKFRFFQIINVNLTALSSPLDKINKCYNQHQIFRKKVYINTSGDVLALPESCPNVTKMVFFSQRVDKAN